MTLFHLGIDVSKAKLDCALRLPNGKFRCKAVANNAQGHEGLADWLTRHGATEVHACMEATGVYWEGVAQFLSTQGFAVSVANPAQIKAYGASRLARTKTDAVDARLIADFCAERNPPPAALCRCRTDLARLGVAAGCPANHADAGVQSAGRFSRRGAPRHSGTP